MHTNPTSRPEHPPRPCPVCGSTAANSIRQVELAVPADFSLQHAYAIKACAACGTVFHDVKPQADRDTYYESYTGSDTVDYQVSPDQARFNDLTTSFLDRAGLRSTDQAIVDVGCSFGLTLMSLKQRGFHNLFAIDPDRAAIRYLEQRGISGRAGSIADAFPECEGKFDLIILRHVLEHLHTPLAAIENVAKWLKPDGRIYIELPDLSRYAECGPFPGYFFEYEHINHFSLHSLLNLMRGFELIQYESTPEIYPCQRALFARSDIEKALHFASADAKLVENSFACANEKSRTVLENIARLGGREIALWGVSTFVYRLLTHTPLKNCNLRHLVDRNPARQGERLLGLTIQAPESLRAFGGDIVICGENSAASIEQSIRSLGFENNVVRLLEAPQAGPASQAL